MAGKGDKPRPMAVDKKTFDENFDRIFGKKDKPKSEEKPKEPLHKTKPCV